MPNRWSPSPYLLLVIPPLCWAGNFVIGRAIHADISPVTLTFWRWVVASVVLLPLAAGETWRVRGAIARQWPLFVVLSATGVVLFQYFVYRALQSTTAINAVLILAMVPVAIPLTAFLFDRTVIRPRQAGGIALSLAGVAIIVARGDPALIATLKLTPGDLWIAAAVVMWALYSVLLRRHPRQVSASAIILTISILGVLALIPVYALELTQGGGLQFTVGNVLAILYVGLFASVVAFLCWNRGVAEIGPSRAGLFIHLMPVFTALLAMFFLGETLHPYHGAGIGLIACGLYLSSSAGPRGKPRDN